MVISNMKRPRWELQKADNDVKRVQKIKYMWEVFDRGRKM